MPTDVTEQTFDEDVIARSHDRPVIADFWAEWCEPCHRLAPILEQEAENRDGAVELVRVDIEANPALATRFGVLSIPAVKGFRDGRVVAGFVGAVGPAVVSSFVDLLLAPPPIERALAELRSSGELPELVAALEGLTSSGELPEVDLDAAAQEIEVRRERWERDGFSVGALTWRDAEASWPQKIETDRGAVADPDSVGVAIKSGDVEASVVFFRGGWGDVWAVDFGDPDAEVFYDHPEAATVEEFGQLLDDVYARVRGLAERESGGS